MKNSKRGCGAAYFRSFAVVGAFPSFARGGSYCFSVSLSPEPMGAEFGRAARVFPPIVGARVVMSRRLRREQKALVKSRTWISTSTSGGLVSPQYGKATGGGGGGRRGPVEDIGVAGWW